MSVHGVLRRYELIVEVIRVCHLPTFEIIKSRLKENSFEISPRTIQRDIQQIRNEFCIDIGFDRAQKGYFIEEHSKRDLNLFLRFTGAINNAELLQECLKQGKKALNLVIFDSAADSGGTTHLITLFQAIKKRRLVSFSHSSFYRDENKACVIRPYFLKEYQGRWYLIGKFEEGKKVYSFGLDRVTDLEILPGKFPPGDEPNPSHFFSSVIGISESDAKPEEIILSVDPDQMKFLKTVPLHHSQAILAERKNEVLISLNVVPNYELRQQILKLGDAVTVLQPASLAKQIKETLKAALKGYA